MTWGAKIKFKEGKIDTENSSVWGDAPDTIQISGSHNPEHGGGISISCSNGYSVSASNNIAPKPRSDGN